MKTIVITDDLKRIFGENISVATPEEILASIEGNTTGLKAGDNIVSFEGGINIPATTTIPAHKALIYKDGTGALKRMSPVSFANSDGVPDKKNPESIVGKKVVKARKELIGSFNRNTYQFE